MSRKTFNLIIKIVLTLLALASGILAFALQMPGRYLVLASIYGILYFIAAISFWFEDKKSWIQIVMIASLVITLLLTIAQSIAGIPLGVFQGSGILFSWMMVLFVSPGVLGLIYFNLNTYHDNWDLLNVFMKIILSFEVGIVAFMLIFMLEVSGGMIWSLPRWGQYLFVYGIMLLAILDIIYAIINWLNFYHGKIAWITTALFVIEVVACLPFFGMPTVPVIVFVIIMLAIVIFTAYLNNRIKAKNNCTKSKKDL